MQILILGDCASSGSNVLTGEITGDPKCTIEYSLTWRGQYINDLILWYLRRTQESREKVLIHDIPMQAINYLHEQEMRNSYWKFIDHSVKNCSKNGATAGGYFKRLKKYESKKGKPDVIFVTDYGINHNWQVVNHKGSKYFFERTFDPRYPEFQPNKNTKAPVEVQKIAHEKAKHTFEINRVHTRNKRIMSWFLRYLDKNNYCYHKLKMYGGYKEFEAGDTVDCSDLVTQYRSKHGDIVYLKNKVQPLIAERVIKKHSWLKSKEIYNQAIQIPTHQ